LPALLTEIDFQKSRHAREEGRVADGRIKNIHYVIKGAITDFTHVSASDFFARVFDWDFWASGRKAVVSLTVTVVDVESGEVVASETISRSASAGSAGIKATYRNVAFGGEVFARTPLGKATRKAIDKSVRNIIGIIASQPWTPRIAEVHEQFVIVNGGKNRHLKRGDVFRIYEPGRPIFDPETGDLIGRHPQNSIGKIEVIEVHEKFSRARILEGNDLQAGMPLEAGK
jgi:hypothetical protein